MGTPVQSWRKIAGTQLASFTHPAGFQDGVLILEVRHSALIAELTPSLDLIRDRINGVYGSGFCAESNAWHLCEGKTGRTQIHYTQ